jgi:hypothetical protein
MHKKEDYKYIGHEHVIALMNHKYDIDWLMAWILSERFKMLGVSALILAIADIASFHLLLGHQNLWQIEFEVCATNWLGLDFHREHLP